MYFKTHTSLPVFSCLRAFFSNKYGCNKKAFTAFDVDFNFYKYDKTLNTAV